MFLHKNNQMNPAEGEKILVEILQSSLIKMEQSSKQADHDLVLKQQTAEAAICH